MNCADELAAELRRLRMFPPPDQIPYLRALVRVRGEKEAANLRAEVGVPVWEQGISLLCVSDPQSAVRRACGFGALLTEFLIAPLRFSTEDCDSAASLGARVNLIVTLYDNLIDQDMAAEEVLPQQGSHGRIPLMPALVQGYYARLRPSRTTALLHRAIARMRDAEDAVASGRYTPILWRRKNALPWVVMGMASDSEHREGWRYLAWLYRVGCFFGWIDDAADIQRDAERGRPNRFALASSEDVTRIAASACNLLKWWDRRCHSGALRNAFLFSVCSWIDLRPK